MKIWLLPALGAATMVATAPADAAMTAVYANPGAKSEGMRVEIADDGKLRVDLGEGIFTLIRREGRTYVVIGHGDDRLVADIEELRAASQESRAKTGAAMCASFAKLSSEMKLVQRGSAVVQGRTGDMWFRQNSDGTSPAKPDLVISHDPALAPLGAAIAEEYRASTSMLPDCPAFNEAMAPMRAALTTGAPIAMQGMELVSLDAAAIDPHRFDLPAPPRTAEELRKGSKLGAPVVTIEARPQQ